MKRNLKFWTRYTWENGEIMLVVTAFLSLLILLGREKLAWDAFAATVSYLLLLSAVLTILLVNTSSHQLYIPLLIAMGETRRNILYGFWYYRLLTVLVTAAACGLIWLLVPGEVSQQGLRGLPVILVNLLLAAAVGSIGGTIAIRWKWVGLLIIMVPAGIFGGLVGYLVGGGAERLGTAIGIVSSALTKLSWPLVLAAAVLQVADILFQRHIIMTREAKI